MKACVTMHVAASTQQGAAGLARGATQHPTWIKTRCAQAAALEGCSLVGIAKGAVNACLATLSPSNMCRTLVMQRWQAVQLHRTHPMGSPG
jgi:hypothetical protein